MSKSTIKPANPDIGGETQRAAIADLATEFAKSLLQNSTIGVYLKDDPLWTDRQIEGQKVGAYLADRCYALAEDFYKHLQAIKNG